MKAIRFQTIVQRNEWNINKEDNKLNGQNNEYIK
jgi:hypothetical protein